MTGKDVPGLEEAQGQHPGRARRSTSPSSATRTSRCASRAAKAVRELGFVPVPHISARRLTSQGQLEEFLARLQDVGATEQRLRRRRRPDHPRGPVRGLVRRDPHRPAAGLRRARGQRSPATRRATPTSRDDVLWRALEEKSLSLTQQGLDADDPHPVRVRHRPGAGLDRRRSARAASTAPIRIGTPGPAGIKRLLGFARRFGIGANAMIVKKYGFSLTNLMGTAGPDKFVTDLSAMLADTDAELRPDDGRTGEAALLHVRRPAGDVRVGSRVLPRAESLTGCRPMTVHNEALRDHACLIVHGPDKPGIVAAVTALITRNKGNIVSLDQYSDDPNGGDVLPARGLPPARPDRRAARDRGRPRPRRVDAARPGVDAAPTSRCRSGWRSSPPRPTTACSSCCGGTAAASCP